MLNRTLSPMRTLKAVPNLSMHYIQHNQNCFAWKNDAVSRRHSIYDKSRLLSKCGYVWTNKTEINISNYVFTQRYVVKSRALFLKSTSLSHPIFGSGSEDWEMSVVSKDLMTNSNASIIGIIQNSFASATDYLLQIVSDIKKNVILEPIFEEIHLANVPEPLSRNFGRIVLASKTKPMLRVPHRD